MKNKIFGVRCCLRYNKENDNRIQNEEIRWVQTRACTLHSNLFKKTSLYLFMWGGSRGYLKLCQIEGISFEVES